MCMHAYPIHTSNYIALHNAQITEVRCVRTRAEQLQILAACHLDPSAGHMGERRTIKRISERYMWRGIVKDVQEMVITRM